MSKVDPQDLESSHETVYPYSRDFLWSQLKPFDKDEDDSISQEELDTALMKKDEWGQFYGTQKFPDRAVLLDRVDSDHDGAISRTEAISWKGLQGEPCRNMADQNYGCKRRCTNGRMRSSGMGTYFQQQYDSFLFSEPSKGWPMDGLLDKKNHHWGTMTFAQAGALERGLAHVIKNKIPGAIAEMGIYDGGTSHRLAELLNKVNESDRELHLYDSFAGLPLCDRVRDNGMCAEGNMDYSLQTFTERFKDAYDGRTVLHKSLFQNLTPDDMPEQIAFAFLDGDLYGSIKSSLEVVYPRLSKGAVVFVHDWGWEGYPGTELASSEFLGSKPENMMLPAYADEAGGFACYLGLLIKQ